MCISGQPRVWKRCYQSWFDSVAHFGDVDVFYHMWNFNTYPNMAHGYTTGPLEDKIVPNEEFEEMKNLLKPKAYKIEEKKSFSPGKMKNPIAWWTRPQFYGIKQCAFLKRQYEIENNFEYDIVFRIRTDLVLRQPVAEHALFSALKPNTLHSCVNHHDPEYKTFRIGDIFYYTDSYTYDQVSCFYDSLSFIDASYVTDTHRDYPPEIAFYYYLKSIGVANASLRVDCKIARSQDYASLKGKLDAYEVL